MAIVARDRADDGGCEITGSVRPLAEAGPGDDHFSLRTGRYPVFVVEEVAGGFEHYHVGFAPGLAAVE